ncbi:8-amino-7-oxononanoate synthase [Aliiglaciecola lipolytica]|uniref:8-amino-7-oxononanoate synthase n=1 Tax=Aliiglaciecola lipolytica E3 TaxID=1127673 RepID=K6YNP0_9ALTE|nr:8-amino-7-oxononanoate synthase [Aliiglaciecola lipolytica]GAC12960.1 8-amino-7-oxononanoate synthase [Aliiglaciecola lipolytica E3]
MAFAYLQEALKRRKQDGLLRQRQVVDSSAGAMITVDGQHYLNFSGNDYLGQRQNLAVMQAWVEGISEYGVGSGASPLVTGHTRAHQQLEEYIASGLKRESALLFNSGFAANQAICQALATKHLSIVSDKLMHASFVEAAMHCDAVYKRFRHNDMAHLTNLLADKKDPRDQPTEINQDLLIATEGIFSMDGDAGELTQLKLIAQQHDAWLMVDDAHGMGVLGKQGLGSIEALNLSQDNVPVVMGTFGKGIGTAGAFVAGSQILIDYMLNFAKHYVYSTAMPPAMAMATFASFQSLADGQMQAQLTQRISQFRHLCSQVGLPIAESTSAIQPIVIGDPDICTKISTELKRLGLWVAAIRSPTVPKGTDRLRITLAANHTQTDIEALVDALLIVLRRFQVVINE